MIRILISIFAYAIVSSAMAAPIEVRSGEHGDFTRLVARVPANTAFELEQDSRVARLTMRGHTDGFETKGVFSRISRGRVAELRSGQDHLEITLGCDCAVRAFREGDMVVLDIRKGPRGSTKPNDFWYQTSNLVGQVPLQFSQTLAADRSDDEDAQKPSGDGQKTAAQSPADGKPVSAGASVDLEARPESPDPPKPDPDFAPRIDALRDDLVRQLGYATSRGLLEVGGRSPLLPTVPKKPVVDVSTLESELPANGTDVPTMDASQHLKITTSADTETSQNTAAAESVATCPDPEHVSVAEWGDTRAFTIQLSEKRRGLFGEFDAVQPEAVLALARFYVFAGFGAEARATLNLYPTGKPEAIYAREIADILERGDLSDDARLTILQDCDGPAALWSVLAKRDHSTGIIRADTAIREASALPVHLRRIVLPALSRRLLALGESERAAAALRQIERTPGSISSESGLAQAEIAAHQGLTETSEALLNDVVRSNSEQSAAALLQLVKTHLSGGRNLPDDLLHLLEAYALEFRGNEIERDLYAALISALSARGRFDEAFRKYEAAEPTRTEPADLILWSALVERLAEQAEEAEFAQLFFRKILQREGELNISARAALTRRLLGSGFITEAEDVATQDPAFAQSAEGRLLRAEIALSDDRPARASALLFSLDSEAALRLRARAQRAIGAHDAAARLFARSGDVEDQKRAAFFASDWDMVARLDEGSLAQISEHAQRSDLGNGTTDAPLEHAESLADESAAMRGLLQDLLAMESLPGGAKP